MASSKCFLFKVTENYSIFSLNLSLCFESFASEAAFFDYFSCSWASAMAFFFFSSTAFFFSTSSCSFFFLASSSAALASASSFAFFSAAALASSLALFSASIFFWASALKEASYWASICCLAFWFAFS
jgi:hypothetical protein